MSKLLPNNNQIIDVVLSIYLFSNYLLNIYHLVELFIYLFWIFMIDWFFKMAFILMKSFSAVKNNKNKIILFTNNYFNFLIIPRKNIIYDNLIIFS